MSELVRQKWDKNIGGLSPPGWTIIQEKEQDMAEQKKTVEATDDTNQTPAGSAGAGSGSIINLGWESISW